MSAFSATPAQAAVVTFACPGGGIYKVDNGVLDIPYDGECAGAVVLDDSVTRINYATYVPEGVTSIEIPSTTTLIENQPFIVGSGLTTILVNSANANFKSVDGILFNKTGTLIIQYPQAKLGSSYTVPSNVTEIGNYAFSCAANLNVLTIPDSVLIANNVDRPNGCNGNGISEYVMGAGNPNYSVIDGVLFNKTATRLISYPENRAGTSYVMPSSVTVVGYDAMGYSKNQRLQSVTLSPNLTKIEYYAFISLNLETLELPASLTTIEPLGLNSIKSVTIAAGNTSFTLSDGVLYNHDMTTMYTYFENMTRRSFVVPETVTRMNSFVFGNGLDAYLTRLTINTPLVGTSPTHSFSNLKFLNLGDNFTTADGFSQWYFQNLKAVNYCGTNAQTIASINAKLASWNHASLVCETQAPQFTLSSNSETATSGVAINGFTIVNPSSVSTFSISPQVYNYYLNFDATTGALSGTMYSSGATVSLVVTGSNAFGDYSQTFNLEIRQAPTVEYYPEVPFISSVISPQLHKVGDALVCTAGTYNSGVTVNNVVQSEQTATFTPSSYAFSLLADGKPITSLGTSSTKSTISWKVSQAPTKAVLTCGVSVSSSVASNTSYSSDNSQGHAAAQTALKLGKTTATEQYKLSLKANAATYMSTVRANRTKWQKKIDATRANYYTILDRLKASPGSGKMIADATTALEVMKAAKAAAQAEYIASRPLAIEARDASNATALSTRDAAIAKANAIYGTFIESSGYGVLIP